MHDIARSPCSFCSTALAPDARAWRGRATLCQPCAERGLAALLARSRDARALPTPGVSPCGLCDQEVPAARRWDAGDGAVCDGCLASCAGSLLGREPLSPQALKARGVLVADLLAQHLPVDPEALATQTRVFPERMRVDVHGALEEALRGARLVGLRRRHEYDALDLPKLYERGHESVVVGPLQHVEVDVGEARPRRCVKQGLWLGHRDGAPFAVLLTPGARYTGQKGLHVEVATPPGREAVGEEVLAAVEAAVRASGAYRGKVLSLEVDQGYDGRTTGVKVHRLRAVERDQVVLPAQTIELLERNVFEFARQRERLKALGLPIKKGLLFHGPPGTGKTHTVHYLAAGLPGHTTLLVTAAQVGLLDEYVALARLLEPSILVIEDADLIGRDRGRMSSPCEESLLNQLLNEMDGLREDAAILFVLTTNRPDQLEPALAARPGRIDQAIEFPLPDLAGRRTLVRLYARGLLVDDALVEHVAARTDGVSAAFVKELMRRTAQAALARRAEAPARVDVDAALDEMLLSGGQLTVRLLGGRAGDDA